MTLSGVESCVEFGDAEVVGKPDVSFLETESHKQHRVEKQGSSVVADRSPDY